MSAAAQISAHISGQYSTHVPANVSARISDQILLWVRASVRPSEPSQQPSRNRPRQFAPELAFYLKYTEAMLRRYVCMSLEAGRVPSLLGKEMFRGNVTSCEVHSFDDVVIFIHDIESCIGKLDNQQQWLIRRIALQQFTPEETGHMLGLKRMTVIRRYHDAMNRLTAILLEVKLLEPLAQYDDCCQEGGGC